MRALTYEHGRLTVSEINDLVELNSEPVVDVIATGVCGTDVGVLRHGHPVPTEGVVMGHEILGTRRSTRQRVVVNPIVGCSACAVCERGDSHLCPTRKVVGVHLDGGFAPSVSVPEQNILVVPAHQSVSRSLFTEPLATALHAWRRGHAHERSRVAVIGGGAIGLGVILVAGSHGIGVEECVELDSARADHALAAGAQAAGAELNSSGFDLIFDCVGVSRTRRTAIDALAPGGTAVFIGLAAKTTELDAAAVVAKEKTIHGAFGYSPRDFRDAGRLDVAVPDEWIQRVTLDDGASYVSGNVPLAKGAVKLVIAPKASDS